MMIDRLISIKIFSAFVIKSLGLHFSCRLVPLQQSQSDTKRILYTEKVERPNVRWIHKSPEVLDQ